MGRKARYTFEQKLKAVFKIGGDVVRQHAGEYDDAILAFGERPAELSAGGAGSVY